MARQGKLFPEPALTVKVDRARAEPRLWVRRLVLWAKPGEVVREVRLRRGLNIVWSPDPGAQAAEVGGQGGSGHGAGKTLFCRLLRYCFGEDTFASDDLRARIGTAFPEGLVGAELSVSGATWGVVRPLGVGRRILAGAATPEELLTHEPRGTGLEPLIGAIRDAALPADLDEHMPGTGTSRSWLIALAWLTRDQECRFGHLLDWRHPSAEARSPAGGLSKEDRVLAVRLLLGAITPEEIATRATFEAIAPERQRLEREAAYLEQSALRMGRELAGRLAIDSTVLSATSLAIAAIQAAARERLRDAEAQLGDEEKADVSELRARLEQVVRDLAVFRDLEVRTRGLIDLQREQVKALRGERANLDAEAIKARLGPMCPVCNVPIDEALARGCGLSHVLPDRDQLALDQSRIAEQLANCKRAIDLYENQVREKDRLRRGLEQEEATLRERIEQAEAHERALRKHRREQWLAAAKAAEDAERLEAIHGELAVVRQQLASLDEREGKLKEELQAHRERHASVLSRLNDHFRYVCRALLGSETDATIALTGQGLRADVQVGGTAMESLKAVAFDIAALMMSLEGRTRLPALLVHDSPREADLGISHYHRLFRFLAKVEMLAEPPPFQYIVTTTTNPPEEMIGSEAVVLRLQGTEPSERLFRRDL